ncbi:MAG: efflux RND transporter periplasmic adaptor subunit [Gemmataceae bacterium]
MGSFSRSCPFYLLFSFVFVVGCAQPNKYAPPPPPEVTVANPVQKDVMIYKEFPGQLKGFEEVEVRARVKGYLREVLFAEGEFVERDTLLYTIEPDVYEAKRDQASAELKAWQTEKITTRRIYEQATASYNMNAVNEEEWLRAQSAYFTAESKMKSAEAALREADFNLKYAKIRAEITGVISESYVDAGNLVGDGQATLLSTIIRRDPIHAEFSVSSNDLESYREVADEINKKTSQQTRQSKMIAVAQMVGLLTNPRDPAVLTAAANCSAKTPVKVALKLSSKDSYRGDDGEIRHKGFIDFVDNQLDPVTATYKIRARFPNPQKLPDGRQNTLQLLPGERVVIRVPVFKRENALLVPEDALAVDQVSEYLLVVNQENKVERRKVKIGNRYRLARTDPTTKKTVEYDYLIILDGIGPDDRVIVNGLQRARPGAEVKPIEEGNKE